MTGEYQVGKISPILAASLAAFLAAGCMPPPDPLTVAAEPNEPLSDDADPDNLTSGVLTRVAKSTAASGDLITAVSIYRRAQILDKGNYDAALGLARILSRLGAHGEAIDVFRRAIVAFPKDPELLRGYGNALIALDQPAQAIVQFEKAMRVAEDVRLFNGLGVAYDKLNDHRMAQAFYQTGLDTEPGNTSLSNNLGLSLMLSGEYGKSIDILRKVAADERATPRHRLNLALAFGLAGESKAAAEIARMDLDEASVQRNLIYYETLRALDNPKATAEALRTHFNASTQTARR